MSLLLVFHDESRAVVCSDDLAISFSQDGAPVPASEKVCKFVLIGGLIFGAVGRSDICQSLSRGTQRLVEQNPSLSVSQLAEILPAILRQRWASRTADNNLPIGNDALEVAAIAHDGKRIRSYVFTSGDNFRAIETTSDPNARVFALGAYGPSDTPRLEQLTHAMERADGKGPGWVAAHLEATVEDLHARSPRVIGAPWFYAAIDRNGVIALPGRFTPAPEVVESVAAHHVTTLKDTAQSGVNRFFVGSILTPVATAPDTVGNADGGNGIAPPITASLSMSAAVTNGLGGSGLTGNGAVSNLENAVDGDYTTKATLSVTGNSGANEAIVALTGPPAITQRYVSLTLQLVLDLTTNSLNHAGPLDGLEVTYSTTGPNGLFTTFNIYNPPTTFARTLYSITLPANTNPSQVVVIVGVVASSANTAGSTIAGIYDARIIAQQ